MPSQNECKHVFGDGGTLEIVRAQFGYNILFCIVCDVCGKQTPWRLSRAMAREDGIAGKLQDPMDYDLEDDHDPFEY